MICLGLQEKIDHEKIDQGAKQQALPATKPETDDLEGVIMEVPESLQIKDGTTTYLVTNQEFTRARSIFDRKSVV